MRLARVDPVMQHCKLLSHPIFWNQTTYTSNRVGTMWEHQARHGFKTGVALAVHSPGGQHFFVGVDRNGTSELSQASKEHVVHQLRKFAEHARQAALRLFAPESTRLAPNEPLTEQEVDCLKWSMDGLSPLEIGSKMTVSQDGINFALLSAMRKLNCSNKYQAVLKAIRLGLFS
jgi:DNA-binding CsgD family transcriptional regulator